VPVIRFQQMDVYVAAIEYVGQTRQLVLRLRRSDPVLADQLHRAIVSIPLNIAEGAGEYSPADKARFYRYALRSCTETLAILDVCRKLDLMKPDEYSAYDTGNRVVAMLTRLVASTADRAAVRPSAARREK
jgi:four helix bundle protein